MTIKDWTYLSRDGRIVLMHEVHERPPVWQACADKFGEENIATAIFAYGDTIFNPAGMHVDAPMAMHEMVHMRQQKQMAQGVHDRGPVRWWAHYLDDPRFRYEEEVEAYGAQLRAYSREHRNREHRSMYLRGLATSLTSPMYGLAVDFWRAYCDIRHFSGIGAQL